jgi:Osmosensitive K+ channel histidine kinase
VTCHVLWFAVKLLAIIMGSPPSLEFELLRFYQQLAETLPQANDVHAVLDRCAVYIDTILPGSSFCVVWNVQKSYQVLDSRCDAIDHRITSPPKRMLNRLANGEFIIDDDLAYWCPLRLRGKLHGWITLMNSTTACQPDQVTALQMLCAVLTPTLQVFLPEEISQTQILQLRTLNEIGQTLSSLLHIDELPKAIYQAVSRLLYAPNFYIALYDEQQHILRPLYVVHGGNPIAAPSFIPPNVGLLDVVVRNRTGLLTRHYTDECIKRNITPRSLVNQVTNNAWMCVPILAQEEILGVMTVSCDRPDYAYTSEHFDLLQSIAAQASVAVLNARLYERAERHARQLNYLNHIGRSITSTLDSEKVPSLIMQHVQELLEAEEGSLLLLDEESGDLVFAFAGGPAGNQLIGQRIPRGVGIAGNVLSTGRATMVNNVREDGRFYANTDSQTGFTTRTILAVPLRAGNKIQGVMEVVNKRGGRIFTEEDKRLIEAASDQAVIALENARRFAQVDQALAQRARELDRTNNQLREILEVGNALRAEQRLTDLVWQVTQAVSRSTGFAEASIALVMHNHSNQPYLQRITTSAPNGIKQRDSVSLQAFTELLRPEFQRGASTYLIDHRSADYFALWNDEQPPEVTEPIPPGAWDPRDVLLTIMVDNSKNLLGFLRVQHPIDNTLPTADQVQILEIFANQAAVAIENARLYEEQAHSLRSLTALNALGMAINTLIQSEEEIFSMTARGVIEVSHALGACVLLNKGQNPEDSVELSKTPLVHIGQLDMDPELVHLHAQHALITNRPEVYTLPSEQIRSPGQATHILVTVPLRTAPNTLGVLCVGYGEVLPPAADLEMLTLFAGQAAAAAANLRLWSAVNRGRDQLAAIMASTHDGILLIDPHERIAVANSATYQLCDIDTRLEGRSLSEFLELWQSNANYPDSEWLALREGIQAVMRDSQEVVQGQLNQLTPKVCSLDWMSLAAYGKEKREGLLLILRDITSAKEAERLRQDLTNMIVHDMRSPITSVMTSIDMLFKGVTGPISENQRSILTIAHTSAQQMLEMVNLMLDISRLESGRMPMNRMPQPLSVLVRRAANRILPQARDRDITIQSEIPEQLPLIYADGELIVRVLQNLIDNALKFSERGSTIRVQACIEEVENGPSFIARDESGLYEDTAIQDELPPLTIINDRVVKVSVSDQGIGIAEKDLAKIFDKFGQAGERRGGTGLGLTFCKLVAEAHGGTIGVTSTVGKGSTFYFTLPIVTIDL